MKNLFDESVHQEIFQRIKSLSAESQRQWGKMDAAQMLAHCIEAFKVPLSDKKMPRMFLGLMLGWAIKPKLYNESPWQKNLPTAPNFIIKESRNFEAERTALLELVQKFYDGRNGGVGKFPHPMFGTLTQEQWGKSMYKHLDHHLKQFGV
ncbi:MAG: DUF1569 domain-containing protein [Sphingobacteriales bacterium]|nr:DUF1569 domain-containing protein [Sphingobacteriales bacterium]